MMKESLHARYEAVTALELQMNGRGFSIRMGAQTISLPEVSIFELKPQSPMVIRHMYLGREGGDESCRCVLTFLRPRNVRLEGAADICELYVE